MVETQLGLDKEFVDQLDGDGALAHRRGNPFYRSMPNVAGGEYAGHARLQEQRMALEGPPLRRAAIFEKVLTGNDEAPAVALYLLRQPLGAGLGAYENEQ